MITYQRAHEQPRQRCYADYRTGPVYERDADGTSTCSVRPRPASAIFDDVHAAGGYTQINHPTIFPSEVPGFDFICRGCPWDYDVRHRLLESGCDRGRDRTCRAEEDPQPGPNPFTPTAIKFWEDAIDSGGLNQNKIAAVGSSDSHNAGRSPDPVTQSPIGQATTVVYARSSQRRPCRRPSRRATPT